MMLKQDDANGGSRSIALLIVAFVAISLVGLGFDRLLVREGVSRFDLMALSNGLTGLVAAGFLWQAQRRAAERQRYLQQRLKTIEEMNHHVRNALQVLSYFATHPDAAANEKNAKVVRESVERIEWALREILPYGVQEQVPSSIREQTPRPN